MYSNCDTKDLERTSALYFFQSSHTQAGLHKSYNLDFGYGTVVNNAQFYQKITSTLGDTLVEQLKNLSEIQFHGKQPRSINSPNHSRHEMLLNLELLHQKFDELFTTSRETAINQSAVQLKIFIALLFSEVNRVLDHPRYQREKTRILRPEEERKRLIELRFSPPKNRENSFAGAIETRIHQLNQEITVIPYAISEARHKKGNHECIYRLNTYCEKIVSHGYYEHYAVLALDYCLTKLEPKSKLARKLQTTLYSVKKYYEQETKTVVRIVKLEQQKSILQHLIAYELLNYSQSHQLETSTQHAQRVPKVITDLQQYFSALIANIKTAEQSAKTKEEYQVDGPNMNQLIIAYLNCLVIDSNNGQLTFDQTSVERIKNTSLKYTVTQIKQPDPFTYLLLKAPAYDPAHRTRNGISTPSLFISGSSNAEQNAEIIAAPELSLQHLTDERFSIFSLHTLILLLATVEQLGTEKIVEQNKLNAYTAILQNQVEQYLEHLSAIIDQEIINNKFSKHPFSEHYFCYNFLIEYLTTSQEKLEKTFTGWKLSETFEKHQATLASLSDQRKYFIELDKDHLPEVFNITSIYQNELAFFINIIEQIHSYVAITHPPELLLSAYQILFAKIKDFEYNQLVTLTANASHKIFGRSYRLLYTSGKLTREARTVLGDALYNARQFTQIRYKQLLNQLPEEEKAKTEITDFLKQAENSLVERYIAERLLEAGDLDWKNQVAVESHFEALSQIQGFFEKTFDTTSFALEYFTKFKQFEQELAKIYQQYKELLRLTEQAIKLDHHQPFIRSLEDLTRAKKLNLNTKFNNLSGDSEWDNFLAQVKRQQEEEYIEKPYEFINYIIGEYTCYQHHKIATLLQQIYYQGCYRDGVSQLEIAVFSTTSPHINSEIGNAWQNLATALVAKEKPLVGAEESKDESKPDPRISDLLQAYKALYDAYKTQIALARNRMLPDEKSPLVSTWQFTANTIGKLLYQEYKKAKNQAELKANNLVHTLLFDLISASPPSHDTETLELVLSLATDFNNQHTYSNTTAQLIEKLCAYFTTGEISATKTVPQRLSGKLTTVARNIEILSNIQKTTKQIEQKFKILKNLERENDPARYSLLASATNPTKLGTQAEKNAWVNLQSIKLAETIEILINKNNYDQIRDFQNVHDIFIKLLNQDLVVAKLITTKNLEQYVKHWLDLCEFCEKAEPTLINFETDSANPENFQIFMSVITERLFKVITEINSDLLTQEAIKQNIYAYVLKPYYLYQFIKETERHNAIYITRDIINNTLIRCGFVTTEATGTIETLSIDNFIALLASLFVSTATNQKLINTLASIFHELIADFFIVKNHDILSYVVTEKLLESHAEPILQHMLNQCVLNLDTNDLRKLARLVLILTDSNYLTKAENDLTHSQRLLNGSIIKTPQELFKQSTIREGDPAVALVIKANIHVLLTTNAKTVNKVVLYKHLLDCKLLSDAETIIKSYEAIFLSETLPKQYEIAKNIQAQEEKSKKLRRGKTLEYLQYLHAELIEELDYQNSYLLRQLYLQAIYCDLGHMEVMGDELHQILLVPQWLVIHTDNTEALAVIKHICGQLISSIHDHNYNTDRLSWDEALFILKILAAETTKKTNNFLRDAFDLAYNKSNPWLSKNHERYYASIESFKQILACKAIETLIYLPFGEKLNEILSPNSTHMRFVPKVDINAIEKESDKQCIKESIYNIEIWDSLNTKHYSQLDGPVILKQMIYRIEIDQLLDEFRGFNLDVLIELTKRTLAMLKEELHTKAHPKSSILTNLTSCIFSLKTRQTEQEHNHEKSHSNSSNRF